MLNKQPLIVRGASASMCVHTPGQKPSVGSHSCSTQTGPSVAAAWNPLLPLGALKSKSRWCNRSPGTWEAWSGYSTEPHCAAGAYRWGLKAFVRNILFPHLFFPLNCWGASLAPLRPPPYCGVPGPFGQTWQEWMGRTVGSIVKSGISHSKSCSCGRRELF